MIFKLYRKSDKQALKDYFNESDIVCLRKNLKRKHMKVNRQPTGNKPLAIMAADVNTLTPVF